MLAPTTPVLALAALVLVALPGPDEPLRDIRSKDPAVREAAARALAEDDSPKVAAALMKAAKGDDDLLVVLASIESLDGREPFSGAEKGFLELSLESPFERVRHAAARTFGGIEPEAARAAFLKKSTGKTFIPSATALARAIEAAPAGTERTADEIEKESKKLTKALKSKETAERPVAARALVALARGNAERRSAVLQDVVLDRARSSEDTEIVCAALDAVAAAADPSDLDTLRPMLIAGNSFTTVIERRLELAVAAALAVQDADTRSEFVVERVDALGDSVAVGPRLARIAASTPVDEGTARALLTGILRRGDDASSRAAAAKALDRLGDKGVPVALRALAGGGAGGFEGELEPRVQLQLVQVLATYGEIAGEGEEGTPTPAADALLTMLDEGGNDLVRGAAAIGLGRPDVPRAVVSAIAGFAQPASGADLATVAAVALGRTRSGDALAPLVTLAKTDDWMMRAAAAEGLKQLSRPECVQPLLAMLLDESTTVRATAHRALLRFSGREGTEVAFEEWEEWWKENAKRARYRTKEEERALAEKYGYGVDEKTIYRGLDVVVVPGRGDHIEAVLDRLGIEYRIARAGRLGEAGLHPSAVLLVGCTGEIAPQDAEVVRWYTLAGGSLFTSCWALTYTVEPSFPAVLTKFPSPGEVVDNVFARPTPAASDSPYLRGVFDGGVQPYYSLLGAHLIQVLDAERAEVLLDSPFAAARHGTGDLAAWFRVGHGIVLDTANHFEEQGFSAARGLKKPIDRQAFAVNHMGLTPAKLREIEGEKWWKSTSAASAEVSDLSVFRILTNFVREKRIRG